MRRMALHLVQYLAVFLAETITGLLQRVLTHPAQGSERTGKAETAHWLRRQFVSRLMVPPLVVDAIRQKSFAYNQVVSQVGAVAFTDQTQTVLPEGLDCEIWSP